MSEPSVEAALREALLKRFTPETVAGWIASLPAEARERIRREFLVEKPVRRAVRLVHQNP
jgi:hypothetical protein